MQIDRFSELEKKVANILEKYALLKEDKQKIEARLASKNKETSGKGSGRKECHKKKA